MESVTTDIRCHNLYIEAINKGKKDGVCYKGPLLKGRDAGAIDPDPEACKALYAEAKKKCDALPPDPDSMIQVSGSSFYKKLPDCSECKECEPID